MHNYPERPRNIPGRDEVGEPFTVANCVGYTPEEMARLNAEFRQRWEGIMMSNVWHAQAVKTFRYEVSCR